MYQYLSDPLFLCSNISNISALASRAIPRGMPQMLSALALLILRLLQQLSAADN
jgi:hypothetical protein